MLSILFDIQDQVAKITLNRPDKLNAMNREMALLLQDLLDQCGTREEIRAVYITGAGKGFCAGQDLLEVTDVSQRGMEHIIREQYNPIVLRIRQLNKPVVAAVNGVAAGAGANLALCCDIIIAAASASFIQAFSKIGLIPDTGGTYFLPRLVGWQRAAGLMMLGEKISAADAEKWGMIYKMYSNEDFGDASWELAKSLASLPTRALALTKQALNGSLTNSLEAQLLLEDVLQQQAANTRDHKEGLAAFFEKRPPRFQGD